MLLNAKSDSVAPVFTFPDLRGADGGQWQWSVTSSHSTVNDSDIYTNLAVSLSTRLLTSQFDFSFSPLRLLRFLLHFESEQACLWTAH